MQKIYCVLALPQTFMNVLKAWSNKCTGHWRMILNSCACCVGKKIGQEDRGRHYVTLWSPPC